MDVGSCLHRRAVTMATQQESQTVSRLFLFRDERSSVSGPCWDTVVNYSVENTHNYFIVKLPGSRANTLPRKLKKKQKKNTFLLRKAKKNSTSPVELNNIN